jgi:hypothetical protein
MATQWLPEAVAAWAYATTGLGGILFLRAAAIVVLASVVYASCRRVGSPTAAATVTVLSLLASTTGLNPRPQLVSFVFFALTVAAWRRTADDHRPRWWLVPLFWLWACSHGLWIFGLAVGGITLVALVVDRRTRLDRKAIRKLTLLNGLCALAIAATPLGPELWLAPLRVAGNASWIADEWQRTPFDVPASMVAAAIALASAGLHVRRQPAALWEYAHLAMAVVMLVWMWRLVPLAAILMAPVLTAGLHRRFPRGARRIPHGDRLGRALAVICLLGAAGVVSLGSEGTSASLYPADMKAVDETLDCEPAGQVIFNDFGLSGWLLWRHPRFVPVADLRAEIYSRKHMERFYVAEAVGPGWQAVVRDSGATLALLQTDAPLARALVRDSGWEVAASSPGGLLLHDPKASTLPDTCTTSVR